MLSNSNQAARPPQDFPDRKKPYPSTSTRYLSSLILSLLTEVQDDTKGTGSKVLEYMAEISPEERSALISSPVVEHYLHRLVKHAGKYHTHEDLMNSLTEYFPTEIALFQETELPCSFSYTDMEQREPSTATSLSTSRRKSTGDPLFQYRPNSLPATYRAPQVNLKDIKKASFSVAQEARDLEKSVSSSSDKTRSVGSVGLHHRRRKTRRSRRSDPNIIKPALVAVLKSELDDPQFKASKSGTSLFPQKRLSSQVLLQTFPVSINGMPLRDAFDVIDAFASGLLQSEAESVYLNYSHLDRCNPYDLSVTLRTKVMPEYFIISNFGIIHVFPDGTSDFQTFAEWLREASMFTLMRQIPFFREYKLKRTFWQWHRAVKSVKFHRLVGKMNRTCIRFFPLYADALLKLQHLSEELLTIPFHHLKPLSEYTLDTMEYSLQGSQKKAHQFLLKYFKYCRRIICNAIDTSRKRANDLETEHLHQQFVPEEPLSIQRRRHEKLERDLKAAMYQGERVPDFVSVAEQLVYNCLLKLAREAADSWKEVFICPIPRQASKGFQFPMPHQEVVVAKKGAPSAKHQKHRVLEQGEYFLYSSLIVDGSGRWFLVFSV
jgi:hypothetical protein